MEESNQLILFDVEKAKTLDWPENSLEARVAEICAAEICVGCAICGEYTSMNLNDCRAQGVFVCDKCKAAVLHIRKMLEDGGSIV
jgi:hypothetical protein